MGRPGHIPNGILLPSADFFNDGKTFKGNDEIERMLGYVGVRREQTITSYCGGGIASSVPFFALRFLAGYPDVRLYVESEMGWLKDPRDLPLWTYDAARRSRRTCSAQGKRRSWSASPMRRARPRWTTWC